MPVLLARGWGAGRSARPRMVSRVTVVSWRRLDCCSSLESLLPLTGGDVCSCAVPVCIQVSLRTKIVEICLLQ